jgi:membrane-bound ClpP family serine protease
LPYFNRLVLQAAGPAPLEELVGSAGMTPNDIGVGTVGASMSELRPSGRARFGDKVLDVVTRGEFIEPGQPIEVMEVKGYHVVVRAARRSGQENKT